MKSKEFIDPHLSIDHGCMKDGAEKEGEESDVEVEEKSKSTVDPRSYLDKRPSTA